MSGSTVAAEVSRTTEVMSVIQSVLSARALWAQLPVLSAKQTPAAITSVDLETAEDKVPPPAESGRGQVVDIEV